MFKKIFNTNCNPFSLKEKLIVEILDASKTTKVIVNNKQVSYRIIIVIGNLKGKIGFGISKNKSLEIAQSKALTMALKNTIQIPIKAGRLLYQRNLKYNIKKTKAIFNVTNVPGIKSNKLSYIIFTLLGLNCVSLKIIGSRNKISVIYITFIILTKLASFYENKMFS